MSVILDAQTIRLEGTCGVEDTERLFNLLQADRSRTVDLTAAGHLHAAVVRVMLVLRPPLAGPPADPFVRRWVAPFLDGTSGEATRLV